MIPIANGVETEAWPMVGALYIFSDEAGGGEVCTGTLVGPRSVATAAHCLDVLEQWTSGGFRAYFLRGPSVDEFTEFTEVESMEAHPDWDAERIAWDIAVVTLVEGVTDASPIALGTTPIDEGWLGLSVRLVGWGNVDAELNGSGVKREGLTTVSGYQEDAFTTSPLAGGPATCPGDSGGAVIREDGAVPELVGVISWGSLDTSESWPCGSVQGHARVDAAATWLTEQIAAAEPEDTGDSAVVEEDEEVAACACGASVPASAWAAMLAYAFSCRSQRPRTSRSWGKYPVL